MAETRKFRVKRDHPAKSWKMGREVTEDELNPEEVERLTREGVIEDASASAGQTQRQGDPQPGGTKPDVRK